MAGADARRDREHGASLVEFALLAPILFAVLLGIFTGGEAYFEKITITDAVREGTRFGATLPLDPSWASTVRARTKDLSNGELSNEQICVRMELITTTGSTTQQSSLGAECDTEVTPPATPTGSTAGDCIVKVWSRRPTRIEAIIYSQTVHLTARSVAQFERPPC